jgi:hypothetical protein
MNFETEITDKQLADNADAFEHLEYEGRPFPVQCKACQGIDHGTQKGLRDKGWSLSAYGEYCPKHAHQGREINAWQRRRERWTAYNNTVKKLKGETK